MAKPGRHNAASSLPNLYMRVLSTQWHAKESMKNPAILGMRAPGCLGREDCDAVKMRGAALKTGVVFYLFVPVFRTSTARTVIVVRG